MRAPWPWFGSKVTPAPMIWERFGDAPNFVDPCCGSLGAVLNRPHPPGVETLNDADGLLANAWRAMVAAPEAVARFADFHVSEIDLTARHLWLVERRAALTACLMADPDFYDAQAAGWWIWGACAWIGTGWCSGEGPWRLEDGVLVKDTKGGGVNKQLPHLSAEQGINRIDGRGDRHAFILDWFRRIQARLRDARITCGDWRRVVTPVVTWRHGVTGILFDPPYDGGNVDYSSGGRGIAQDIAEWCRDNGNDSRLRICLCGHDGDYDLPGWEQVPWKGRGGYGNQGGDDADDNRHREMLWFSPKCLRNNQVSIF